jgi:hypothetical protein
MVHLRGLRFTVRRIVISVTDGLVAALALPLLAPSCPLALRAVVLGELVALVAQRTIRADNFVVQSCEPRF